MRWIAPNQSIAFQRTLTPTDNPSPSMDAAASAPRTVIPPPTEVVARRLAEAEARVFEATTRLREALGDAARAELVLDGLTEYQWFVRTHRQAKKRTAKLTKEFFTANSIASDVITQADNVAAVLHQWSSDSDRLHQLADKIESTEPAARSFFTTTYRGQMLAERRAYLRAHVHRALHRLARLPNLTARQRGLRHQLETFRQLEDFPHRPETPEVCAELEALLDTLEPRLAELESEIAILPEPVLEAATTPTEVAASLVETAPPNAAPSNTEPVGISSSATAATTELLHDSDREVSEDVVTPWEMEHGDEPQEVAESVEWSELRKSSPETVSTIPAEPVPESEDGELGWYEMQAGETCVDVLSGETMAPALPAFSLISPTDTRRVVNWVHDYLNQYEYVRSYVGFPVGDEQWWLPAHEGTMISLDRLNDTIVYVAVQYNVVRAPQAVRAQLQAQFQPLEAQLPTAVSYVPHMVARRRVSESIPLENLFAGVSNWMRHRTEVAPSKPASVSRASAQTAAPESPLEEMCVGREADAIRRQYNDNTLAYRSAFRTWVRRAFGRVTSDSAHTPAAVDTILRLTLREWNDLVEQPSQRYRWLLRQHLRPSCWAVLQQVVQRWRALGQTTGAVTEHTTVETLARLTFAQDCCAARTDDSTSLR